MSWTYLAISLACALLLFLLSKTRPPRGFAPGLPVIPIWVSLLPLIRPFFGYSILPQDEVYERFIRGPMEEYGAVVIFFGGCWNVLVGSPTAVKSLFLQERKVFTKSGNHKKLPKAVISQLTGGNIISETGEVWRKYANLIRPSLKNRLDTEGLGIAIDRLVNHIDGISQDAKHGEAMTSIAQRFSMENVTLSVFHRDLGFLLDPVPIIHTLHALVKKHIFQPLFLSFPQLDNLAWLFPSRAIARQSVSQLEDVLLRDLVGMDVISGGTKVTRLSMKGQHSDSILDLIFHAGEGSDWTWRECVDNIKISFVAGHENIQQAFLSCLWVLARDQTIQRRLVGHGTSLRDSPALWAFMHEVLRLYPPIPQLFNRKVAQDTELAIDVGSISTVRVKAGTYIGWSAYALHRHPESISWQPDPTVFRPERWGDTMEEIDRLATRSTGLGEFATFHGGARSCPGKPMALRTLRNVLSCLLERYEMRLPAGEHVKLSPGGLLAPQDLRVIFARRQEQQ